MKQSEMRRLIEPILRQAGRMMTAFHDPKVYDKGRHADFVTEADLAVQTYLIERLSAAFPGARFFAEEKRENELTDGLTFIIDPIDGTTNFFRHRTCSAISVGVTEGRQLVFGAIYNPYRGALYHAEKSCGAYCGDEPLRVSDTPMDKALVGFGTAPYYSDLFEVTGRTLAALLPACADIRRTGSACVDLCDVAAGRSDAHFEWLLQPWDYAAGTLIVREAGGVCGNILGGDVVLERGAPHLAANPRVYEALQSLLQRVYREVKG